MGSESARPRLTATNARQHAGAEAGGRIIPRRVLKPPLIAVFLDVVAGPIILTGWLFNLVL